MPEPNCPKSHPSGTRRLGHHRRRQSDRGAEHVRHEDRRRGGHGRPGQRLGGGRGRRGADRRRYPRGRRGPGGDPPADQGQSLGRSSGELPPGGRGGPAGSTRSATTRATSTTTSGTGRGRTRSGSWSDVAGGTIAPCASGVNCGSVDPAMREKFPAERFVGPMLASALEHCELLERSGLPATACR